MRLKSVVLGLVGLAAPLGHSLGFLPSVLVCLPPVQVSRVSGHGQWNQEESRRGPGGARNSRGGLFGDFR